MYLTIYFISLFDQIHIRTSDEITYLIPLLTKQEIGYVISSPLLSYFILDPTIQTCNVFLWLKITCREK